jgi:putative ABC transport system permease protein
MTLLVSALIFGFVFSLLALGVYVSFRIFRFPDITAEGSFTLGAAVTVALLTRAAPPLLATAAGFAAGLAAGTVTGVLHTRFKINGLLSGILVMTALYSINLHVLGRSNVPLDKARSLATQAVEWACGPGKELERVDVWGWTVGRRDVVVLAAACGLAVAVSLLLYAFLQTDVGTAMRAAGDNPQMIRAVGVNDDRLLTLGLAVANGLVALAGSLLAQYQEFADVQMGIGMMVWGLASVIIGESLVGSASYGLLIAGAVMGSVLFRLLIAIALRWGLNPNDLKLITALFVFAALVAPNVLRQWRASASRGAREASPGA